MSPQLTGIAWAVANQNPGATGPRRAFKIDRAVTDEPDIAARRDPGIAQGKADGPRIGLVTRGIIGADDPTQPPVPAQARRLEAQQIATLVADHPAGEAVPVVDV